ncbi:MAG: response regulator [Chloroflexi bacterium]|jgi:DNA-binding NtrC family response regulator|nr:response regulator [Chloroflexota bacterium]
MARVRKKAILVVDDDFSIREVIARALTEEGYNVVTAKDGTEAVKKASRRSFDLVFLDISMPGQNGLETLSKLKSKHPSINVVVLTAVRDAAYEMVAMRRHAIAYLRKPCGIDEIIEMVNKMLKSRRSNQKKGGAIAVAEES